MVSGRSGDSIHIKTTDAAHTDAVVIAYLDSFSILQKEEIITVKKGIIYSLKIYSKTSFQSFNESSFL